MTLAANGFVTGSTADAGNDYQFVDTGNCQGSSSTSSTSPDMVYKVTVPGLTRLNVGVATTWDSTANIITSLANCGVNDGGTVGIACAAGRDDPNDAGVTFGNGTSSPVDVFVMVDGYSTGLGDFSIATSTTAIGAGDTCENAVPLVAGSPLAGETLATGVGNDYSGAGTGCSSSAAGSDKVYSISIPAGQRLTLTVTPTAFDSSISLVDGSQTCLARNCLLSSNNGASGAADTLVFFNAGATRTFFVIVDSATDPGGVFDISATLATPVVGDVCPSAVGLDAGTLLTAQSSIGLGLDYVGAGTGSLCSTAAAGPDLVYSVGVPVGYRVTVEVRPDAGFDPSVSLASSLDNCNSRTCVAGGNVTGSGVPEIVQINSRSATPATFFAIVDSTSTTGGQFDILASVDPTPVGDTCDTATPLSSGVSQTGTTFGYTNDFALTGTNCSSAVAGQDRTYRIDVPALSQVIVNVVADGGYNSAVNIVAGPASNCDSNPRTCLANDNTGGTNGTDRVRWANVGNASASVFAIVDSTTAATNTASYDITATVAPIPANEMCETSGAPITASVTLMGNLATAFNDYVWGGLTGCTSSGTVANDQSYAITIPAGQQLTAVVTTTTGTWDPSLNIVNGVTCTNTATQTCLAGSNSSTSTAVGSTETVRFTNASATARTITLLVDTSTTASGGYSLALTIAPPPYIMSTTVTACDDMTAATALPTVAADSASSAITALPFAFNYFGGAVSHFSMNSDGLAQLWPSATGTPLASFVSNTTIPSASNPNGYLAPFWDDLEGRAAYMSTASYATFGMAPNRRFTMEWNNWSFYTSSTSTLPDRLRFQVQLNETTNVIEFHYCSMATNGGTGAVNGSSATVGLENLAGNDGLTSSFNTGAVSTSTAVRFTP